MNIKIYLLYFILFLSLPSVFAQQKVIYQKGVDFSVRITIVDANNTRIVKNAEVSGNGKIYTYPDVTGRYIITAKIGDEIRVSHPDFETVYYRLTSSEDLKIVVENYVKERYSSAKTKQVSRASGFYLQHLDSASFYKKKNIEKSLSFIEKALKNKENKKKERGRMVH